MIKEIGEEAAAIFQAIIYGETVRVSKKLLVAPNWSRDPVDLYMIRGR